MMKLRVPVRPYDDALMYLPDQMTEDDWEQFMAVLAAMKPGLVNLGADDD